MQRFADQELARAINQYLTKAGFTSVASSFQDECESRKISLKKGGRKERTSPELDDLKKRLLLAFERGDEAKFFKLFSEVFPTTTEAVSVLEVQLKVHFATVPLRKTPPDRSEYKERLDALKTYLEDGPGTHVAGNTELLPYFALPYVNEPLRHPVFREFLSKKHSKQLQDQLLRLVRRSTQIAGGESDSDEELRLLSWKHAYEQQKEGHNGCATERLHILEYQTLQNDYYNIISIAGELVDCLELTVQGKTIAPELFAEISNRLVDSNVEAERRMQRSAMAVNRTVTVGASMTKRNRSLNNRPTETLLRRRPDAVANAVSVKKAESTGNLIPADPRTRSPPPNARAGNAVTNASFKVGSKQPLVSQLNFAKVSNQLVKNPGTRSSALLLQALRLQLSKQNDLTEAGQILAIFVEKDVLLLKNKKNSVVASIVALTEAQLETKESLARFLNAVASFRRGRDYLLALAQGKEVLYQLALALRTKKLIGFASEHTLATLQKLSLRAPVQKELILSGMIEWLLAFLEGNTSNFGLEYGTALLTNLCCHSVAQSTIFRYKERILALLAKLLQRENTQLVPLVANALFVLFSFAKMRSSAKEVNIEAAIISAISRSSAVEVEGQLSVVLQTLQGELEPPKRSPVTDEDSSEEDYLEAEIDSTDTLVPTMTELFGEALIARKYGRAPPAPPVTEDIAPPGTVPRRQAVPSTSQHRKAAQTHTATATAMAARRNPVSAVPPPPLPPSSPDHRMSSVASHATFIAENSQRRPLLGQTGLKAAVSAYRQQRRVVAKLSDAVPDTHRSPVKKVPTEVPTKSLVEPKVRQRRRSESSFVDDEAPLDLGTHPVKATSTTALLDPAAAPVHGKINSRIPNGANEHEYMAVFGSRPKVVRTPEQSGTNTQGRPKPAVLLF